MVGEWKGTKGGGVPDDWLLALDAKKKDNGINTNGKLALNGSGPFSFVLIPLPILLFTCMLFHINLHVCVLESTRLNLIQASPTFPHKELPIVLASVNIRLLKKKK